MKTRKTYKTELTVTIPTMDGRADVSASCAFGYRERYTDDNGRKRRTTNTTTTQAFETTNTNDDVVGAYISETAPRYAYTAINTNYAHDAHPFLWTLRCDVATLLHKTNNDRQFMNDYTDDNDYFTHDYNERHTIETDEQRTRYYNERNDANEKRTQRAHVHTYEMRTLKTEKIYERVEMSALFATMANGERVFIACFNTDADALDYAKKIETDIECNTDADALDYVLTYETERRAYNMETGTKTTRARFEIIPTTTLDETDYSRMLARDVSAPTLSDGADVVNVAKVAMFELYSIGLVKSYSDFFVYRRYIYRAINQYIAKQRKTRRNECASFITYDDDGNETATAVKTVDKKIERVERSAVHDVIIDTLKKTVRKNANVENIVATYKLYYIDNHTADVVAKKLGVSQSTIDRYIQNIKRTLQSATIKTALHDVLFG